MRVGIDIRALGTASARRGVGTYVRGLLNGLAEITAGSKDEILLFSHEKDEPEGIPAAFKQVRLRRPRSAITLWDQFAWPPLLRRLGIDVFHSPFYALPIVRPRACAAVQTIHDLTPLKIAGSVSRRNALLFRLNFRIARGADRIIADSQATRDDVVSRLGIPESRVSNIPLATDMIEMDTVVDRVRLPEVIGRFGIARPYILHTGGHDPSKNLGTVISAMRELAGSGLDLRFVVSGDAGAGSSDLRELARRSGLEDRVIFVGYVSKADLVALYCGAEALVYPSLMEGFGLPVIEAMACGTPVIASRAGAIPEVGGDACLYVDPEDVAGITIAIRRVLTEPALAPGMAERGRSLAGRFSWHETARLTLLVYRELHECRTRPRR